MTIGYFDHERVLVSVIGIDITILSGGGICEGPSSSWSSPMTKLRLPCTSGTEISVEMVQKLGLPIVSDRDHLTSEVSVN